MVIPWKDLDLSPEESLRAGVQRIARYRLHQVMARQQGVLEATDIEELHDMRIAVRRLWSMLRIFSACFPKKKQKKHHKTIKGLLVLMGNVREHDVFLQILKEHRNKISDRDATSFDLLIAREIALKKREQGKLAKALRLFNKSGNDRALGRFLQGSP